MTNPNSATIWLPAVEAAGLRVWLIDMARMERSWHWPGCPNGGER